MAGLINLACVVGIVALAHRRGGRPLMVATAIALPILLASMPAEAYSDIWNPYMPLLPLLLLLFLAWSVGCGEYRLLPLAVLLASFAPQSHLSFALPAAVALAVGVAGLVASQRGALLRPPARTWIAVAAGVAVACWAFPIAEQVTNDPGNARLLYRAARADQPKLGRDDRLARAGPHGRRGAVVAARPAGRDSTASRTSATGRAPWPWRRPWRSWLCSPRCSRSPGAGAATTWSSCRPWRWP